MTMTRERGRSAPPVDSRRPPNPDLHRTFVAAAAAVLGMVTLNGLIRDGGWMVDALLTAAVVVAPAALVRVWRRPGAFDVWIGVVLMVPWLTLRFVPDHAVAGLIPTRGTLHDLSRLMTSLHHTTSTEVAPVHSTPAIRLVLCALIGLLVALVDLIAVVGRRGALAGIPLLVVYTVTGAVSRHAVPWGWFALAAVGFLLLLSLDVASKRTEWGHHVGGAGPDTAATWGRTGSLLGVVAIVIAVVLPFLVPLPGRNLLADALRGHHGDGLAQFGAGSGDGGAINPFAALQGQLRHGTPVDIASVHVTGPARSASGGQAVPFYLRTNVLDQYSAAGWSAGSHGSLEDIRSSSLYADPGNEQPRSDRFSAQITIAGLTSNPPVFTRMIEVQKVTRGTTWSAQDQLMLGKPVPRGTVIHETFDQADPSTKTLQDSPSAARDPRVQQWLTVPALPQTVTSLVTSLTGRDASPYLRASAINKYFTDGTHGFVYSLSTAPLDSQGALVDFLKFKRGYCQQYAAAEAIMFRQAGIPSRVVLGYMHPPPDDGGNFTVTSRDAHAWVEAYFAGVGWVPFDPTPVDGLSGGAESDLPWAKHQQYAGGDNDPTRPSPTAAEPTQSRPTVGPTSAAPTSAPAAAPAAGSGVAWRTPLLVLAVIVVLAALALTPAGLRTGRRRRRWRAAQAGDTSALWRELTDTAVDLGYVWSPARSPRQVADWLRRDAGADGRALDDLADAVERDRYARPGVRDADTGLIDRTRRALAALRTGRSRRTQLRARYWPASLGWRPRVRRRRS